MPADKPPLSVISINSRRYCRCSEGYGRAEVSSSTRSGKQNPACRFPALGCPDDFCEDLRFIPLLAHNFRLNVASHRQTDQVESTEFITIRQAQISRVSVSLMIVSRSLAEMPSKRSVLEESTTNGFSKR